MSEWWIGFLVGFLSLLGAQVTLLGVMWWLVTRGEVAVDDGDDDDAHAE